MPEFSAQQAQKAFVISPIGAPGTEDRAHADWVLNRLVRAACERAKADGIYIEPERSDESSLPGPIMSHVVNSIVRDRVVFAILAGDRPNVYYELAIAIAAGRPVIILRDKKEQTHFDIKDFRAITYDYPGTDSPAPESKIVEIAGFIRAVMKEEPYLPKVFTDLDALASDYRDYQFMEKFRDIDPQSYSQVFFEAQSFIALQGISLKHFTRQDFDWFSPSGKIVTFFDIVRSKVLFDAVSVHIIMMHETNPALPHLMKFIDREHFSRMLKMTRSEIADSFKEWSALKQELDRKAPERADGRKGTLQIVQLRQGIANYRLTITDQRAIVSPYFNMFTYNGLGACLVCGSTTTMHDRLKNELLERVRSNELASTALEEHGSLELGLDGQQDQHSESLQATR